MCRRRVSNAKQFVLFLPVLFVFLPCIAMAVEYFVPPDMTLRGSDMFNLSAADTLSVSNVGRVDNSGTITNDGFIINSGSITTNIGGTITNNNIIVNDFTETPDHRLVGSSITNSGTFTHSGSIMTFGSITNNAGGTMTNSGWIGGGSVRHLDTGETLRGSLTNSGTLRNISGSIDLLGPITNNVGGTITNSGGRISTFNDWGFTGSITNNGTIVNTLGSNIISTTFYNNGILINDNTSTITTFRTFTNDKGGIFTNNGTFNLGGALFNHGILTGAGTIAGNITNYSILTGTGTFTGNITNDGTIAPGDSTGTMTVNGNYTHNAGAVYQVEVNSAGQSDRLAISGTATLKGGRVAAFYSGFFLKDVPYTYTILTAAGGVNGAFAPLANTSTFFNMGLSYFPTYVNLNLMRRGFASVCESENQCEVAGGIERVYPIATGDMRDVINSLLTLSAPQAREAYDQMGGLIHTALMDATFSSFTRYMKVMSGRMSGFLSGTPKTGYAYRPAMIASRDNTASDAGNTLIAALGNVVKNQTPSWGFWVDGYGSLGERRGGDVSSRFDHDMMGFALGFDRAVTPSLLLGASAGYGYSKVDMKDLSDKSTISSYQGSLYGIYTANPFYVSGIAAYGYNHYDTDRDIAFGSIVRGANVRYNGQTFGGNLEAGYRIVSEPLDIIPLAALTGIYLNREGFTEGDAGSLSLDADSDHASSLIGSLGVRLTKDYPVPSGTVTPELTVRWNHEFVNDDYTLNASFAGYPTSAFTVKGDRPDRDALGVGLGLTWQTIENISINFTYDGTFSGDTTQHAGTLGVRYKW